VAAVLHALRRGADDAEGLRIPRFVLRNFTALPVKIGELTVPNYIESCLEAMASAVGDIRFPETGRDTFIGLWARALASDPPKEKLSVLEPACGSANDYRFIAASGLAARLDYSGFDLCEKNVANARAMFPGVRFAEGNVFSIDAPDRAYALCFVHDLFEHLSIEGMETAVREICRVTKRGICAGFFHMSENPDHQVLPMDDYYWNTLSMARMKALFAEQGFSAQVLHAGTFLCQRVGWEYTHNPKAYTFILERTGSALG